MNKEDAKFKLQSFLLNSRMVEIRYNEIFNLIFEKNIESGNLYQQKKMNLQIDSSFCVKKEMRFKIMIIMLRLSQPDFLLT